MTPDALKELADKVEAGAEPNESACNIQIKATWSSGERIDAEFSAVNPNVPAEIIKLIRATQEQTHD